VNKLSIMLGKGLVTSFFVFFLPPPPPPPGSTSPPSQEYRILPVLLSLSSKTFSIRFMKRQRTWSGEVDEAVCCSFVCLFLGHRCQSPNPMKEDASTHTIQTPKEGSNTHARPHTFLPLCLDNGCNLYL